VQRFEFTLRIPPAMGQFAEFLQFDGVDVDHVSDHVNSFKYLEYALANRPPLVLADEPTGNLDEATADIVFAEFLKLVRGEGAAALVATHNERIAAKMDRVLRLHEGLLH